jgi:hypothetical protein
MPAPYTPPSLHTNAFNCPLCHVYAQHEWRDIIAYASGVTNADMDDFAHSECTHCGGAMLWHNELIIFPDVSSAPSANEDLSPEIRADYAEAASIATKSPRGAAALLRLALQKLCIQLGEDGKNINDDIGSLVRKGLDVRVQKALDTVRVIGNEAVHPGEIDLRDDAESVGHLFTLLNAVANDMITQPRLRDELYGRLPAKKLAQIDARNAKVLPSPGN